jgi:RHS repeat-associated protein
VTLSDNKGNTWTPLTASTVTGTVTERLYYVANPTVGSGHTFSDTGTSNFASICVAAFSGVATSSPFDKENGATSSASTIQTGSVTPSLNQELLVSGLGWNVARTTYPPTLDSSFTVSTSSNFLASNHYGCSIGYLVQSNAAAVNPTWSLGSAQSDAARIATFKPLVTPGSGGTGGSAASTTMRFVHTDNLSGSSVVTDATGSVVETTDYLPFGAQRLDTKSNGYGGERNKYAGTVYDALSGLNYMQARYEDPQRGQFLSEDPVFLAIGNPGQVQQLVQRDQQMLLANPQSLNSYLYAEDNPVVKKDPSGRETYTLAWNIGSELGIGVFGGGMISIGVSYVHDPSTGNSWIAFPFSYGSIVGTPSGAIEIPQQGSNPPFVIGAYAGTGPSGSRSPNAKRPEDLYGTADSANYNGPGVSFSVSGGGTDNPTYTLSPGVKGVASVSQYPMTTVPYLPSFSVNRIQSAGASAVGSVSSAVQQLQAQYVALLAAFNAIVDSQKSSTTKS